MLVNKVAYPDGIQPRRYESGQEYELTEEQVKAMFKAGEVELVSGLRTDGPTLEEWVAKGYRPDAYPPKGWAAKPFEKSDMDRMQAEWEFKQVPAAVPVKPPAPVEEPPAEAPVAPAAPETPEASSAPADATPPSDPPADPAPAPIPAPVPEPETPKRRGRR